MKKLYSFFKKPFGIGITIILLGGLGWALYASQKTPETGTAIHVTRDSIAEEVIVTGKTKPVDSVKLGFQKGGKIARVLTDVGAKVKAGDVLVELDKSELAAELAQARAKVDAAQSKLAELKQGTRPEELRIQEVKVTSAETALEDAKKNIIDKIRDANTKADDVVHNSADQLFNNARSSSPQIFIQSFNQKTAIEYQRSLLEPIFSIWQLAILKLSPSDDLLASSADAKSRLAIIKKFTDDVAMGVNSLTPTSTLSQTTIDGYKSALSTARTTINTAIINLTTAEEKLRSADASLTLEKNELILQRAGNTIETVTAQEAAVREAEASVNVTLSQLQDATLRSPLTGIVTKQDAKIGEIVAANTQLVYVISENNLEIEANVPEVDIGHIAIGNPVTITLDAFPGESFKGKVIYIDPAETIVDGVVNYKIKVNFDTPEERFKSGLTSNLSIETMKKIGVLVLPQYAILENDRGTFVRKNQNGKSVDIPVTLGIRSKDGFVEIISGVQEGDEVLNIGLKPK